MLKLFRKYSIINSNWIALMAFSVILSIIGMTISLYEPMVLGEIIDSISGGNTKLLYSNMVLYGVCSTIGIITISLCRFILNYVNLKFICKLRTCFYDNVISSKVSAIQRMSSGDLISKFEADIDILSGFISGNLVVFFVNITSVFVIIYYMAKVDFKLTIFLVILVPINILIVKILGKFVRKYASAARKSNSEYIGFFEESINGIKDIKSFEGEEKCKNQMKYMQDDFSIFNLKVENIALLINAFNKFFLIFINILIIFAFMPSIAATIISVGIFVAFINYTGKLYSALFGLSNVYTKWKSASISLERITEVLFIDEESIGSVSESINFHGDIIFKDVSFNYESGKRVLKNFNARFESQKINILTGISGAGKTTLCEVLLSFYDISAGEILINGINLKKLSKSDLRSRISYISQTTYSFDMNVFEYLKVGDPNLKKDEASHILNLLGLSELSEDVLADTSKSSNIKIQSLSAGQKQRLSIARGLVKNADIYIFDEPTSALDVVNKKYVLEIIGQLVSQATVIMITHDEEAIHYYPKAKVICIEDLASALM